MRINCLRAVGVATVLAALFAGSARASSHANLYITGAGQTYQGTRATINNPTSGQRTMQNGDYFLASVLANDGTGSNQIQQGILYEWNAPQSPDCKEGLGGAILANFVEIQHSGVYQCYVETYANTGESHLHSVRWLASNNTWYSYLDGVGQGITTSWTPCSGKACAVDAFAETWDATKSGLWYAKFAGSGNTPWQWNDGTNWNTISGSYAFYGTNWQNPYSGPFPTGIWSLIYQH